MQSSPEGRRPRAEGATREGALVLKRIRLELGRTTDFPEGSPNHGYEFVVPLTEDGQIDLEAWEAEQQNCTVLRFWGTTDFERGELIRLPEGGWAFSYAPRRRGRRAYVSPRGSYLQGRRVRLDHGT